MAFVVRQRRNDGWRTSRGSGGLKKMGQPLMESEVKANLRDPGGRISTITLRPLQDAGQPGVYVGQFVCGSEGLFEMELPLGTLGKQEILNQQVLASACP